MKRDEIVCGAHNALELGLVILVVITRNAITEAKLTLQIVGYSIVTFGILLMVYAGIHLLRVTRSKTPGEFEPLATAGPYRVVRHPYYLGAIIVVTGLSLALRTYWGIGGTLFLLIPSAMYVAKLEDQALEHELGDRWRNYADRTYFMFPPIY